MQFERLCGRRIVPHLLALLRLLVTCHQSGHIPPPCWIQRRMAPLFNFYLSLPPLLNPWETR